MKIIVTHSSPDMDAITSVWLIRRFLPGWENAKVEFVPAGERMKGAEVAHENFLVRNAKQSSAKPTTNPASANSENFVGSPRPVIEKFGDNEMIHVDTGLGPLDHHQTASDAVCGASLTFDFVKRTQNSENKKREDRMGAVERMVKVVVDIDHFKEVFWQDATADYHEFSVGSVLDGLKLQKQNQDDFYVGFISDCLDAILHEFENRIWAEEEIKNNGVKFKTRFGNGIGFETINDSVIKLSQKTGYVVVVRKDPRKGYVRVKAMPSLKTQSSKRKAQNYDEIDLTLAYEKLKKMDPNATWFLHVSKKMLLNGSVKNPKMRPTKLKLSDIIKVLEQI